MIAYVVTFILSSICAWISGNNFKNNRKRKGIFYGFLAVFIPSFLAGIRIEGIGTDTLYYIKRNFYYATISGTFSQFNSFFTLEFLYNLLVFFISRLTTNIHFLYFSIQFIIMGFIYLACYNERDKAPIWLSYLAFMLLYFNRSLNMVRQSLALAMIIFGFKYVKDKKILKYLICCFVASLFHKTAFLGIFVYFLYHAVTSKNSLFYKIIIVASCLVFLFVYQELMLFLIESGIVSSKYLFYVVDSESTILMLELLREGLLVLLLFLYGKNLKKYNTTNNGLVFFMILDLLLYLVGIYANYAQRISYYFGYFDIFIFSQIPYMFQNQKKSKFMLIVLLLALFAYWYIYYCVLGYDATYPFISIFS